MKTIRVVFLVGLFAAPALGASRTGLVMDALLSAGLPIISTTRDSKTGVVSINDYGSCTPAQRAQADAILASTDVSQAALDNADAAQKKAAALKILGDAGIDTAKLPKKP